MVSSNCDEDFLKNGVKDSNDGDLLTVKGSDFFGSKISDFSSKFDLIYSVFKATDGQYVVIEIVAGDNTLLFTNGSAYEQADLSDSKLVLIYQDEDVFEEANTDDKLVLKPDYYLVVVKRN